MKACTSSFAEITKFLTQIQTWQRQNYSCSWARISFQQQHRLSSLYPFHPYLLSWDSATVTGSLSKLHWETDPGGKMGSRRKKRRLLFFITYQFCNLVHYRCTAAWQQEQTAGTKRDFSGQYWCQNTKHRSAPNFIIEGPTMVSHQY